MSGTRIDNDGRIDQRNDAQHSYPESN